MDVVKQVAYWRSSADEDWDVARELLEKGRARHGLFFAHLTLEKLLKALVTRATGQPPPRIHNLIRLTEQARLTIDPEQVKILAEMNEHHIEGRYPRRLLSPPSLSEAREQIRRADGVRQWLIRQL